MAFGLQWERSSNITCRQVEFQHIWKASKYAHKHETENPNQTQPPGVALLDAVPCGFREEGESGRKLILRGERHAHDMVYLYSSTVLWSDKRSEASLGRVAPMYIVYYTEL